MSQFERYEVSVDGHPTQAVGVDRVGALAFATSVLDGIWSGAVTSVSIYEQATGEFRACWVRGSSRWFRMSVPGWLSSCGGDDARS